MRQRTNRQGERGQGIAYVLVLSAALLVFLIAIVDVLWTESRLLVKSRKSQELFHEVDGAVDRAMFALLKEGNWEAVPQGLVVGYQADVTYDDIPGIRYRLKVQEGNWTPYDPSFGPEEDWTAPGDKENERTITVYASRTTTGERRKLQAVVLRSSLRSALFSGGQINITGSSDVHWGPVVSYADSGTVGIDLNKGLPGHPIFLSTGKILIQGTEATALGKDSDDPLPGVSVNEEATESQVGKIPTINYDFLREAAKSISLTQTDTTDVDFYQSGPCQPLDTYPKGMSADTVMFLDTVDGEEWDGGNCKAGTGNGVLFTITQGTKGQPPCGKGTLVVVGDLNSVGTGCVNAITMTPPPDCFRFDIDPKGCQPITNPTLWWDGLVIVAGALKASGNKKMYGSIYASDTAGVTGSFEIWYKTSNEQLGLLGKTIATRLWLPRKPFSTGPPEPFPD